MSTGRPAPAPLGYRVVAGLLRLFMRLLRWRIDVRGLEHVPRRGGAVLTFNHNSHLDYATLAIPLLGRTGRWVRLMALEELWGWPPLALGVRIARCIPVDREDPEGREAALREAASAARAGQLVLVAPEGTISPTGALRPFHTGAARIARAAGVPVVPTVSWGTQHFTTTGLSASLRRGWRLPVAVAVGRPVQVAPDDDPEEVTARLEEATAALVDEVRTRDPWGAGWRATPSPP